MEGSVLVINCGSSSVKLALYSDQQSTIPTIDATAERLGSDEARLKISGDHDAEHSGYMDHAAALKTFVEEVGTYLSDLAGIGHRVVHGGESFAESVLIDSTTLAQLEETCRLAPLHNPMNLMGIRLCQELFADVPNVAVFDTAFHQSIPKENFLYGVPYDWYTEHQVRRYGFHGSSYRFISAEAGRRLECPADELNLIVAHLGNGCSACAIRQGRSVDSSMGLTPLEGLIMGTRSGDTDPGLINYMMENTGRSASELTNDLNRESGLKGLSGISNDMRTLLAEEASGNADAARAINAFCFRVARQLAALSCNLSSTDAVIFTGGIGEHAADIRRRILAAWRNIPFRLSSELNEKNGDDTGRISAQGAPLVLVIPTDEERMIAEDTYELVSQ